MCWKACELNDISNENEVILPSLWVVVVMVQMCYKYFKLNKSKKMSFVEVRNLFDEKSVQAIISHIFGLEKFNRPI